MNNTKERRRGEMRNWRGKAVLAGYIALFVLLIILTAIISLRLSAQVARAASERVPLVDIHYHPLAAPPWRRIWR